MLVSTAFDTLAAAMPILAAGGGSNPFAGRIYQAAAAAIVFIALFMLLKSKAWGPILKGLQDRENKIKNDLEEAERQNKQAAETLKEYQSQLADAQNQARKVIEQARTDASRLAQQEKDQAIAEINSMRQRAEADIRAAKEQAVSEIYTQVATVSTQVAGKILQREVNADDNQQLIEQALGEIGSSNN